MPFPTESKTIDIWFDCVKSDTWGNISRDSDNAILSNLGTLLLLVVLWLLVLMNVAFAEWICTMRVLYFLPLEGGGQGNINLLNHMIKVLCCSESLVCYDSALWRDTILQEYH